MHTESFRGNVPGHLKLALKWCGQNIMWVCTHVHTTHSRRQREKANTALVPHKNVTTEKADADRLLGGNVGEGTEHRV